MSTKTSQAKKTVSTTKSNATANGGVNSTIPARPQKAPPSQAQIAQMAYEIWISTGKQPGRDQQNWFEAEVQLRQM